MDGGANTAYFDSYANIKIHEQMLKDVERTGVYRTAIEGNAALIKGKVVLDVGCGTGVLSMFAARAGAARVFGVDASDIIHTARKIVAANGFDGVVTLLQGRIEEEHKGALPARSSKGPVNHWKWKCVWNKSRKNRRRHNTL